MGRFGGFVQVCVLACVANAQQADWPQIRLERVAAGLRAPTHLADAGDGSGRLFVVEQAGRIMILRGGTLLAAPFLDIVSKVGCCGERGLLSVAFPPEYAARGHFYVYYTDRAGDITVARYRVSANPDVADAASETVLLSIPHRQFGNHNGGQLAFGPDGFLYVGTGDGGGGGDTLGNAQSLGALLGKILRIDVEAGGGAYAIPPGNPFAGVAVARPEIWAYGLRNPWRFSFDRLTRDLYIADVGQQAWEEINFEPAGSGGGRNYGWNQTEGRHCFQAGCNPSAYTLPVAEYPHPEGCSVTGGFVYRGARHPALQGIYFYGDYCRGQIWGLRGRGGEWQSQQLLATNLTITSFGEDAAGELYVLDAGGEVYALRGPAATGPAFTRESVVNAASFEPGISPGSIATIFGTGFAPAAGIVAATETPLPTVLSGVSVTVNGVPAPLFAVANVNGREQINFQTPWETAAGATATIVVNSGGASSEPVSVTIASSAPALFTMDGTRAAAVIESGVAVLYATGLGQVDSTPSTGAAAPLAPLSRTTVQPTVTIGGRAATVLFAGLAPGFAGLYQINAAIPEGLGQGDFEVVASSAGRSSKPARIAVTEPRP